MLGNYIVTALELTEVANAVRAKKAISDDLQFPTDYADFQHIPLTAEEKQLIERTIESINDQSITRIGSYAFASCANLTTVNAPSCSHISERAFQSCSGLTNVSFPLCTYIGPDAFESCTALTAIAFPSCKEIREFAFNGCNNISDISFPACTDIWRQAFTGCDSITSAFFPACIRISSYAFYSCKHLSTASFPTCSYIHSNAFQVCFNLLSLYLLGYSVATLANTNAFSSTPISTYTTSTGGVQGSIFVRQSLLASWKAATNWATYSSRFVGLTDAEIAALGS